MPQKHNYLRSAATAAGIILVGVYIIITAPFLHAKLAAGRRYTCGETIEEAVGRGCTFDPLTVTWLPAQCSRAGTDEFLAAKRNDNSLWKYYLDGNGTAEVANLGSRLGDRIYWTTKGEHLSHCAYILIRGAEAQQSGHHTRHCALFLLEAARSVPDFDEVNTAGSVKLGAC